MRRGLWLSVAALSAATAACGGGSNGGEDKDDGGVEDGSPTDGSATVDVIHSQLNGARMIVPAYFYPGADWDRVRAASAVARIMIFNPDSGPGTAPDPEYQTAVRAAQQAGIRVLGYVATDYGRIDPAQVLADIDAYYRFYAPSGIYLAEGPNEADCALMETRYRSYADEARLKDPKAYTAVGTRFCPTYITFFDMMVQYARGWQEYQSSYEPPAWMPANSPERFCHIIYDVPAEEAGAALERAAQNGAGWVYVTDGTLPNPWGGLPSYFSAEVNALTPAR